MTGLFVFFWEVHRKLPVWAGGGAGQRPLSSGPTVAREKRREHIESVLLCKIKSSDCVFVRIENKHLDDILSMLRLCLKKRNLEAPYKYVSTKLFYFFQVTYR